MNMTADAYSDYGYDHDRSNAALDRLLPAIERQLPRQGTGIRVLDVGCGNGFLCRRLLAKGFDVVGIDLSESGIEIARRASPAARFEVLAADDRILRNLGTEPFDFVISTEVIEHVYAPRPYMQGCLAALEPGGTFICTTPYHGYLKNLLLSLAGHWDRHADPLWDGGHIKLWSRRTLSRLFAETGFTDIRFLGAGRLPYLWMSMVMTGRRPHTSTGEPESR